MRITKQIKEKLVENLLNDLGYQDNFMSAFEHDEKVYNYITILDNQNNYGGIVDFLDNIFPNWELNLELSN